MSSSSTSKPAPAARRAAAAKASRHAPSPPRPSRAAPACAARRGWARVRAAASRRRVSGRSAPTAGGCAATRAPAWVSSARRSRGPVEVPVVVERRRVRRDAPSGVTARARRARALRRCALPPRSRRAPRDDAVAQVRRHGANSGGGVSGARPEPGVERTRRTAGRAGEVGVRDAPAAREQVEGERHRVHVRAPHAREVARALAGGLLEALDDRLALELVVHERALDVAVARKRLGERDRVLHGQLRARADREVRGVGGVAQQHDVAAVPALVADQQELIHSERLVMRRWPLSSSENSASQTRSSRPRRSGRSPARATCPRGPRRCTCWCLVEGVRVDLEEAGLGLLEDEGEGVEHEVGAEPDELAALRRDAFAEVRPCRARGC